MFERLRENYLSGFQRSLAKARAEFAQMAAEVMLEMPRPAEPELLYRIWRVDIVGQTPDGPKVIEINVDPAEPLATRLEGFRIPVTIHPAVWNGLEFVVEGEPPPEATLLAWIAKWLDIDDQRYVEGADFQGVVHNCLRPSATPSGYWTSVDFGSAPVHAVRELVEILMPGARSMQIGSGLQSGG